MSRFDEGPPADDEPLGRPFLHRTQPPGATPYGGPPGPDPWAAPPPPPTQTWYDSSVPSSPPPPGAGESDGDRAGRHAGEQGDPGVDSVRPYLLTGGRTQASGPPIAMETVVLSTGLRSSRGPAAAGLERSRILQLAERPCSAAEVAAHLHLPLQVALVLVTDLVAEGLLDASVVERALADDVVFLERLIAGVAAL